MAHLTWPLIVMPRDKRRRLDLPFSLADKPFSQADGWSTEIQLDMADGVGMTVSMTYAQSSHILNVQAQLSTETAALRGNLASARFRGPASQASRPLASYFTENLTVVTTIIATNSRIPADPEKIDGRQHLEEELLLDRLFTVSSITDLALLKTGFPSVLINARLISSQADLLTTCLERMKNRGGIELDPESVDKLRQDLTNPPDKETFRAGRVALVTQPLGMAIFPPKNH